MCMVLTSAAAAGAAAGGAAAGAGATSGIMATLATMATKVGGALASAGKAAMASGIPQAMGSGALWGAGINAAMSALQGNSIGDIAADAGKGAAVGAATGGIAKGISIGAGKVGSLLKANKAAKAGTEATKTTTTAGNTNTVAPTGQAPVPGTQPTPGAGTGEAIVKAGGKPQLRPKADLKGQPISVQLKAKAATGKTVVQSAATKLKTGAGKVAGQVGVQGALSIASGIAGAKQANAANEISRQSLLFQQQTYTEQKAEVEANKAKLKQEAWTDYSSSNLFGEQLYGSTSNNTLLTSYHTNGTGNQGSFSILNYTAQSNKTDLT